VGKSYEIEEKHLTTSCSQDTNRILEVIGYSTKGTNQMQKGIRLQSLDSSVESQLFESQRKLTKLKINSDLDRLFTNISE